MIKKLISYIVGSSVGVWVAVLFVPGVWVSIFATSHFLGFKITAVWQLYLLLGVILGLLNLFVKPVLDTITLPLRIITLGIFGFVINMALIWVVDYLFKEFSAPLVFPLLWTTLIIFATNTIIAKILTKEQD